MHDTKTRMYKLAEHTRKCENGTKEVLLLMELTHDEALVAEREWEAEGTKLGTLVEIGADVLAAASAPAAATAAFRTYSSKLDDVLCARQCKLQKAISLRKEVRNRFYWSVTTKDTLGHSSIIARRKAWLVETVRIRTRIWAFTKDRVSATGATRAKGPTGAEGAKGAKGAKGARVASGGAISTKGTKTDWSVLYVDSDNDDNDECAPSPSSSPVRAHSRSRRQKISGRGARVAGVTATAAAAPAKAKTPVQKPQNPVEGDTMW